MMEMKAKRAREACGDVYQLSRADYEKEMVEGSKDKWVILHLYQDSKIECRLLANHLRTIAARKKDVKFLKIVATDCIEDYPDRNCPTLIAYHEGKMQKQFVGLSDFGGKKMVADDLEFVLAQFGVCETDIETNPRITETIKVSPPALACSFDRVHEHLSGKLTLTVCSQFCVNALADA
jgi:hypothetical protein